MVNEKIARQLFARLCTSQFREELARILYGGKVSDKYIIDYVKFKINNRWKTGSVSFSPSKKRVLTLTQLKVSYKDGHENKVDIPVGECLCVTNMNTSVAFSVGVYF